MASVACTGFEYTYKIYCKVFLRKQIYLFYNLLNVSLSLRQRKSDRTGSINFTFFSGGPYASPKFPKHSFENSFADPYETFCYK